MRFKIPTKYPLEIAAVGFWIISLAVSCAAGLREQKIIDEKFIIETIPFTTIFALVYYIFLLRRELKRLKSK